MTQNQPGTAWIVFEALFAAFGNLCIAAFAAVMGIVFLTHAHGWALLVGVALIGYAIYGLFVIVGNILRAVEAARS